MASHASGVFAAAGTSPADIGSTTCARDAGHRTCDANQARRARNDIGAASASGYDVGDANIFVQGRAGCRPCRAEMPVLAGRPRSLESMMFLTSSQHLLRRDRRRRGTDRRETLPSGSPEEPGAGIQRFLHIRSWVLVVLTACTVRVGVPFRIPPPDPVTKPVAERALRRDAATAPEKRRTSGDERARDVARSYDAPADQAAADAQRDLQPQTSRQRAVLAEHGKPTVRKRRTETCWFFIGGGVQEVFCWNAAGTLTKHRKDPSWSSVSSEWSHASDYDEAATFASGECGDGGCARGGWTNRGSDGFEATTACNGDCLKRGWITRFSDGTAATTECVHGDCARRGWTTRFPDGNTTSSECDGGDCLKYGWTTPYRLGFALFCDCGGVCTTEGATCTH